MSENTEPRFEGYVGDWTLCFLCQQDTNEKLVNPLLNSRSASSSSEGYESLASNLVEFHKIRELPFKLDKTLLENDLKCTLASNNALWHKSCYLKCNKTKLDRAKERAKRKMQGNTLVEDCSPVKTRRSHPSDYIPGTSLFC